MSIAYRPHSVLPIAALATSCLFAGMLLSGAMVSHFAESKAAAAARQTAAVRARITLLESVLRRQAEGAVSFSAVPKDPVKRPDDAVAAAVAPVAAAEVPAMVPGRATGAQVTAAAAKALARKDRAAKLGGTPAPAPEVAAPVAAAHVTPDALPKPVSAAALAAAKASNKIEGISAEKIGVAKIDPSGVVMRSGGRIPVGGRFPSGERLLAVDAVTGQIITDARTVIVID